MLTGEDHLGGQQLAELLKQLRIAAGISGRELARRTYISQTKVSRIESGEIAPSMIDVQTLARALDVDDVTTTTLLTIAKKAKTEHRSIRVLSQAGWHHRQRELRHLEQSASEIRYFLPSMLTGLLQTPEYARASVTSPVPTGGSPDEIAANKIKRQEILNNPNIKFAFLLTLSALTWPLLPPEAMGRQHHRLIELCQQPNISLRVIDTGTRVIGEGPLNTFVIYDDHMATAETFSGDIALTEPADITYHRELFNYFQTVALMEDATCDFITGQMTTVGKSGTIPMPRKHIQ
jgi:transcriptional regulator with XRE-family HTH domain